MRRKRKEPAKSEEGWAPPSGGPKPRRVGAMPGRTGSVRIVKSFRAPFWGVIARQRRSTHQRKELEEGLPGCIDAVVGEERMVFRMAEVDGLLLLLLLLPRSFLSLFQTHVCDNCID